MTACGHKSSFAQLAKAGSICGMTNTSVPPFARCGFPTTDIKLDTICRKFIDHCVSIALHVELSVVRATLCDIRPAARVKPEEMTCKFVVSHAASSWSRC